MTAIAKSCPSDASGSATSAEPDLGVRLHELAPPVAIAIATMLATCCRQDHAVPGRFAAVDLAAVGLLMQDAAAECMIHGFGPTLAPGEACARILSTVIAAYGSPAGMATPPRGSWNTVPLADLDARMQELGPELMAMVGDMLAEHEGAQSSDPVAMSCDIASTGMAMVLGGGQLIDLALRGNTAVAVCEQAYRDILDGLADLDATDPAGGVEWLH